MDWNVSVKILTLYVFCICILLNAFLMRTPIYTWKRSFNNLDILFRNRRLGILLKQQSIDDISPPIFNSSYHFDLVVFTSFKPSPKRYIVHNNTKRNWPSLGRKVRAVLFTNDSTLVEEFTEAGWDIMPLIHVSKSGTPILKYMFMEVSKRYDASFFGYSNSDILFTEKLTKTLEQVKKNPLVNHNHLMLTGRRINVNNITWEEAASFKHLSRTSKMRGVLFRADAEDYFLTNRFYPWNTIIDIVIGRVAYDNFLLLHARLSNFSAIDLSKTVDAVHQTVDNGHLEEKWKTQEKEKNYNKILIRKTYHAINYFAGQTNCLEYETQKISSQILIYQRKKFAKYCAFKTSEVNQNKTKVRTSDVPQNKTKVRTSDVTQNKTKVRTSDLTQNKTKVTTSDVPQNKTKVRISDVTMNKTKVRTSDVPQNKTKVRISDVTMNKTKVRTSDLTQNKTKVRT